MNATSPWPTAFLGDLVVQAKYGLSLRGSTTGETPILRMNCQDRGRVVFRDIQYVSIDAKTLANYRLEEGDLLFNRTNSYELVGRTALFSGQLAAVFASYLIRLKVDRRRVDPEFLNFYLNWAPIQRQLKQFASRGVSQSNISASKLRDLEVVVPSVAQQRAIAAILAKIQEGIDVQISIVATLKELKAVTMAKLFREGLRRESPKETEIGTVPKSWAVQRLGDLLVEPLRNGHSAVVSHEANAIPTLTLTAVTKRRFTRQNVKMTAADPKFVADLWLRDGDVFVERANTREMVGLAALYRGPSDLAIFPDLLIRVRVDQRRILPEFLVEWLLSQTTRQYYKSRCSGAATSMLKIDQQVVAETLIPVPSPPEQEEIKDVISTLDRSLEVAVTRVELLGELFESTLNGLMSGAIRCPVEARAQHT